MTNILPYVRKKVSSNFLIPIPPKWKPSVSLGLSAFSFNSFVSINANARLAGTSPQAGERQVYRLFEKQGLSQLLLKSMLSLVEVSDDSLINVDFSIFDPFAVLCFALQTKDGRAVPLYVNVIKYPVEKGSQNFFIIDCLTEFIQALGCSPRFVFDRGFMGKTLNDAFDDLNITFYLRVKAGLTWISNDKNAVVGQQWKRSQTGTLYGKQLRVVRSSHTKKKKVKAKECWFILTNDFDTQTDTIIEFYYHRFEIEETFKDIKHILDTNTSYFKKTQSLTTILWFQLIGFCIAWLAKHQFPHLFTHPHPKKKQSWFRTFFELFRRESSLINPKLFALFDP